MQEQLEKMLTRPSVNAFLNVLYVRDRETAIHSFLVSSIAVEIGKVMNIDHEQLVQLYMGTLLHDIGKLAVPEAILSKPAKLETFEREIIRQHPVTGYTLIESINCLDTAAHVILSHHERYDGLGYPLGLKGEKIHLLARICAVADTLAAMLLERPYRKKVSIPAALAEVHRCSGTQFDPRVVDILPLIDMERIIFASLANANNLQTMLGSLSVRLEDVKLGKVI